MPSSHLILCRPLLPLTPIPPSIRVFSNESTLHMRWPKYWSFSFSIIPSKEHPGLIYFRMDWLDLLAVQGTLKSLLQHHSSKASILRHSAFSNKGLSSLEPVRQCEKWNMWKEHQTTVALELISGNLLFEYGVICVVHDYKKALRSCLTKQISGSLRLGPWLLFPPTETYIVLSESYLLPCGGLSLD